MSFLSGSGYINCSWALLIPILKTISQCLPTIGHLIAEFDWILPQPKSWAQFTFKVKFYHIAWRKNPFEKTLWVVQLYAVHITVNEEKIHWLKNNLFHNTFCTNNFNQCKAKLGLSFLHSFPNYSVFSNFKFESNCWIENEDIN